MLIANTQIVLMCFVSTIWSSFATLQTRKLLVGILKFSITFENLLVSKVFTFWLFDNVQYSFNTTRPIPLFLHHVLYIMGYMYSPLRETRRLQEVLKYAQLHRLTLQLICRNFMRFALAEAFRVVQLCVFLLSALTSSLTCSLNAQASFS